MIYGIATLAAQRTHTHRPEVVGGSGVGADSLAFVVVVL